jgi:hypothetical protein
MYNTQSYSGSALCPSSVILNTRKHNVSESLRLALSKGPNRVGVFPPLTLGRKQIYFPKRRVF